MNATEWTFAGVAVMTSLGLIGTLTVGWLQRRGTENAAKTAATAAESVAAKTAGATVEAKGVDDRIAFTREVREELNILRTELRQVKVDMDAEHRMRLDLENKIHANMLSLDEKDHQLVRLRDEMRLRRTEYEHELMKLHAENVDLRQQVEGLRSENVLLREQVGALERQIGTIG